MEQAAVLMLVFICVSTFVNMYMTYRCQHNAEYMQQQNDKFKEKVYEIAEHIAQDRWEIVKQNQHILNTFSERVEKMGQIVTEFGDKTKVSKVENPKLNWRQKKKIKEQAKI